MPFSKNSGALVGMMLSIQPEAGWGWRLIKGDELLQVLNKVPDSFQAKIAEVLCDTDEVRGLLAGFDVEIAARRFAWGFFLPHTDSTIDLRSRSVHCNILLSDHRPYLSQDIKYPDPRHVWSVGLQLRGYGKVSLHEV